MSAPAPAGIAQEARDYLRDVEAELADLPAEERGALLEDLEQHLEALAEEGDDCPVLIRLGSPAAYAEELRAAAGLPARGAARSPARTAQLRREVDRLRAHPLAGEVRQLLHELRPGWWVLRGYLVVAVPCLVTYGWVGVPVPEPLGSPLLGFVLVLAAIAASVALGRRQLPRPVGLLVNAAGALLALVGLTAVGGSPSYDDGGVAYASSYDVAVGDQPLVSRYGPVTDVLPYASDGTPLEGVLLYDQDGRPLQVGLQEWWADGCARVLRQPLAADGVPVPQAFPQTYVVDPSGVDGFGNPAQCDATVARPEVPLPVFPAPATAGPTTAPGSGG
ncbi:HAAS signaling domain-containing protein [Modestobacter versicolor]|uniref:Plasmid stabilization system protein ParE n=1 Tax=Modestobacter versicolor TaxID=429133 RepID=A0A323VBG9_9ACTN|nr:hypothetical protein [Modestobacter versicolor]MBB3677765.1 plasmid stabilization system protein ParE [Modestobacter versicolor]PZA21540.1 hypothetical protein DMO24_09770 [Modestobacter versicolor]